MSLSIVFGTCTTWIRPADCSSRRIAVYAVSSPPMVIRCVTSRRSSERMVFSSSWGSAVGLARAMPMIEPPREWMRLTPSIWRGRTWSMLPRMIHSNPSWIPSTSTPSRTQRIVAAPITALIPGAGPPPTTIATFLCSFILRHTSLSSRSQVV